MAGLSLEIRPEIWYFISTKIKILKIDRAARLKWALGPAVPGTDQNIRSIGFFPGTTVQMRDCREVFEMARA